MNETRDGFLVRAYKGGREAAFGVGYAGKIWMKGESDLEAEILEKLHLEKFAEQGTLTLAEKEILAREAGEDYASEQIHSDEFDYFVWEQLSEAERNPTDIDANFTTENLARDKRSAAKLAGNLLTQIFWDIERDLDWVLIASLLAKKNISNEDAENGGIQRAFLSGIRHAMTSSDAYCEWVAEEIIMPTAKNILSHRAKRKK